MLLSRLLLLLFLFGIFNVQLIAGNTNRFELRPTILVSPDTTSCPDDFLIDLGPDIRISYGDSIGIYVLSNRAFDGDEQWVWSDPTGLSCLMCPTPSYSPTESTVLILTIVDGDGCIASAELYIEVTLDDDLFVPNAFSPNGDGTNDQLVVFTGRGVEKINHLQIFSRKGDLVYDRYNFPGNSYVHAWDGQFKGEPVNAGTFVYLLEVEFIDGSIQQLTGTATLVR